MRGPINERSLAWHPVKPPRASRCVHRTRAFYPALVVSGANARLTQFRARTSLARARDVTRLPPPGWGTNLRVCVPACNKKNVHPAREGDSARGARTRETPRRARKRCRSRWKRLYPSTSPSSRFFRSTRRSVRARSTTSKNTRERRKSIGPFARSPACARDSTPFVLRRAR